MRWEVEKALRSTGPVKPLVTDLEASSPDEIVALWVEDVCWQAQLVHWRRRRPPWWSREARREWRLQRQQLDDLREALVLGRDR
jgi:hypothetical protein